uniref:Uncharacterized protein n=1 Tax=Schistosoma haematobium TaxID=6185 RepID=A0A095C431_SCHHA
MLRKITINIQVSKSEANEDIMKLVLRAFNGPQIPKLENLIQILSSEKWLHNYKLTFNNTGIQNEEHLRCPTTSSFVGIFELLKNISEKM